jgi:hypothetical protein
MWSDFGAEKMCWLNDGDEVGFFWECVLVLIANVGDER